MQSEQAGEKASETTSPVRGQHPGTVPVLHQKIIAAREAVGWSQRTLAKRTYCSLATIKSVESGKDAFPSTLEKICKPLGLKLKDLIAGVEPVAEAGNQERNKKVSVRIFLSANSSQFDETKLKESISGIRETLRLEGEITVVIVEEGSVIVTLEMDEADAVAILQALEHGDLPGLPPVFAVGIKPATGRKDRQLGPETLDSLKALTASPENRFKFSVYDINNYEKVSKRYPLNDRVVWAIEDWISPIYGSQRAVAMHRHVVNIYNTIAFFAHMSRLANAYYAMLAPLFFVARYTEKLLSEVAGRDAKPVSYWWFHLFFWSIVSSNIINALFSITEKVRCLQALMICSFCVNCLLLIIYYCMT